MTGSTVHMEHIVLIFICGLVAIAVLVGYLSLEFCRIQWAYGDNCDMVQTLSAISGIIATIGTLGGYVLGKRSGNGQSSSSKQES